MYIYPKHHILNAPYKIYGMHGIYYGQNQKAAYFPRRLPTKNCKNLIFIKLFLLLFANYTFD